MSFAVGLGRFLKREGVSVEFLGTGANTDANDFHLTAVAPHGSHELEFARALTRYLDRRGLSADTVVVVNTELYSWSFRHLRPRPPIVLVLHGPTYPTLRVRRPLAAAAFRRLIEGRALSLAKIVLAIDQESLQYVRSRSPETATRRISLPIDIEHFQPYKRLESKSLWSASERPTVLLVGRLAWEKDPRLALSIHQALLDYHPDAQLLIAGEGPLTAEIARASRQLGGDVVRILGFVPQSSLPGLYSAGDALLISSRVEQLPNVLLESLACGTQVFSTDVGDASELLRDGRAGSIIPRDPGECARILGQRIPENEGTREKYLSFRRGIARRHSWETLGPQFLEVLYGSLGS